MSNTATAERPPRREYEDPAPSDAECALAWRRIMTLARRYCLVINGYGGVVTLATPEAQREVEGVRDRTLRAHMRCEALSADGDVSPPPIMPQATVAVECGLERREWPVETPRAGTEGEVADQVMAVLRREAGDLL